MTTSSQILSAFTKVNNKTARCLECNNTYSCSDGTASSLWNHLKSQHKNIHSSLLDKDQNISEPSAIEKYLQTSSSISTYDLDICKLICISNNSMNSLSQRQNYKKTILFSSQTRYSKTPYNHFINNNKNS